ncbi:hypothetical protein OKW49_006286 [Paraburkholderia youngii]
MRTSLTPGAMEAVEKCFPKVSACEVFSETAHYAIERCAYRRLVCLTIGCKLFAEAETDEEANGTDVVDDSFERPMAK